MECQMHSPVQKIPGRLDTIAFAFVRWITDLVFLISKKSAKKRVSESRLTI